VGGVPGEVAAEVVEHRSEVLVAVGRAVTALGLEVDVPAVDEDVTERTRGALVDIGWVGIAVPEGVGNTAGVAFAVQVPRAVGTGAANAEKDLDAIVLAGLDVLGNISALIRVALIAVDAASTDLAARVGAIAKVVDECEDDEVDARTRLTVRCETLLVVVALALVMDQM
jgi:hypothetical protein